MAKRSRDATTTARVHPYESLYETTTEEDMDGTPAAVFKTKYVKALEKAVEDVLTSFRPHRHTVKVNVVSRSRTHISIQVSGAAAPEAMNLLRKKFLELIGVQRDDPRGSPPHVWHVETYLPPDVYERKVLAARDERG